MKIIKWEISNKQLISAVITTSIYAAIFNWKIAALLMISIGFHEHSHLFMAKRLGLKTNSVIYIPFVGGVSFINDRYKSYWQQALVVMAGPIGGGALALFTTILYFLTGNFFIGVSALFMTFLNLFNTFPLSFLDGGQLMDSITYSLNETLGLVCKVISTLIAIYVVNLFNPLLTIIIAFIGSYTIYKEIRAWGDKRAGRYWLVPDSLLNRPEALSSKQILKTLGIYSLTFLILSGMFFLLRHHLGVGLTEGLLALIKK